MQLELLVVSVSNYTIHNELWERLCRRRTAVYVVTKFYYRRCNEICWRHTGESDPRQIPVATADDNSWHRRTSGLTLI